METWLADPGCVVVEAGVADSLWAHAWAHASAVVWAQASALAV